MFLRFLLVVGTETGVFLDDVFNRFAPALLPNDVFEYLQLGGFFGCQSQGDRAYFFAHDRSPPLLPSELAG